MEADTDSDQPRSKIDKLAGCLLILAVLGAVLVLSFLQLSSTHLLCFDPNVQDLRLNGKPLRLTDQCHIYNGFAGSDLLSYMYQGRRHRFRLEPDLSDDNSTVVFFGDTARVEGKFRVVQLE